ncbi:LysR family transcriptional regulator [Liquorilactobacillus sucicola DSM 21376 = JCM 15457]|uniref:LysR family transcriptional regulator n=1 Tax=Liquorilactobacillus sucicola TaxID=519050 RepID=UPI000434F761|nr:LysR family transcriptional regulator [Liquorilactobacillus sucicola]GAJ26609.1 LysR family transcriptional regulator [Liquorilactobacillus sucicola DSM 21376 = JCM 15457]
MLDQLYLTFLVLTQTLSYTKTAEQLYISQPAVTQQIQRLEEKLDLKLVHYHRPNLKITQAGEELADFLQRTSVQAKQVLERIQTPDKFQEINFSTTRSLSVFLAPKLIKEVAAQKAFRKISCHVGNTEQALAKVRNGESQFALVEGNFNKNKFGYKIISSEPFVAVAAPDHPLAQFKSLTWSDLVKTPLLVRERGSGSREILASLARAENVSLADFEHMIVISEPLLIRQLLLEGVGVSFLYRSLVEKQLQQRQLVELPMRDNGQTAHDLYIVYAKDSYFKKDYEKWADVLR